MKTLILIIVMALPLAGFASSPDDGIDDVVLSQCVDGPSQRVAENADLPNGGRIETGTQTRI